MDRVKRIWYLSPMRAAKVQASLRIRADSPEPPLLAHTSSESRGTFRQKARSLAPLNSWACAAEICHDGMLKDTNSLDGAHILIVKKTLYSQFYWIFIKLADNQNWHKFTSFNLARSEFLCYSYLPLIAKIPIFILVSTRCV